MKKTKGCVLSIMALLAALTVTSAAEAQSLENAPIDLAVTYDTLHTNHITSQTFWMQGGAIELGAQFYRGLGIVARVEGDYSGAGATGEPLSLVTTLFGPRYTFHTRSQRYEIFGEGLLGISNGFNSLFSDGSGPVGLQNAGTTSSASAMAVDVGGGLDVRLNHRFAIRAVRASYLYTQFPNTTTNVQNSLSLSAGLVVRLGK
jgi:hypothetical protein